MSARRFVRGPGLREIARKILAFRLDPLDMARRPARYISRLATFLAAAAIVHMVVILPWPVSRAKERELEEQKRQELAKLQQEIEEATQDVSQIMLEMINHPPPPSKLLDEEKKPEEKKPEEEKPEEEKKPEEKKPEEKKPEEKKPEEKKPEEKKPEEKKPEEKKPEEKKPEEKAPEPVASAPPPPPPPPPPPAPKPARPEPRPEDLALAEQIFRSLAEPPPPPPAPKPPTPEPQAPAPPPASPEPTPQAPEPKPLPPPPPAPEPTPLPPPAPEPKPLPPAPEPKPLPPAPEPKPLPPPPPAPEPKPAPRQAPEPPQIAKAAPKPVPTPKPQAPAPQPVPPRPQPPAPKPQAPRPQPPAPKPQPPAPKPQPPAPKPQAPAPKPQPPARPTGPTGTGSTPAAPARPIPTPPEVGAESAVARDARVDRSLQTISDYGAFARSSLASSEPREGEVPSVRFTNKTEQEWLELISYFGGQPIAYDKADTSYYIAVDVFRGDVRKSTDTAYFAEHGYAVKQGVRITGDIPRFMSLAREVTRSFGIPADQLEIQVVVPKKVMNFVAWKVLQECKAHGLRVQDVRTCFGRFVHQADGSWAWVLEQLVRTDGTTIGGA